MTTTRVAAYCDLGLSHGAGHFVRLNALLDRLADAGAEVQLGSNFTAVPWTKDAVPAGVAAVQVDSAGAFAADVAQWADVFVIDSYQASAADLQTLVAAGVPIVAVDDEALRTLPAQVIVNQNLSAPNVDYSTWPGAEVLRGPEFALLRQQFVTARPLAFEPADWRSRWQRVLVLMGGTDAAGISGAMTRRALAELAPAQVRVVAQPHAADELRQIAPDSVEVLAPTPQIQEHMLWADVAITAAGITVWELACLGKPMGLVTVADNQIAHAKAAVAAGIAVALGTAADVAHGASDAWRGLRDVARVNALGLAAYELVDGQGAKRVAGKVLEKAQVRRN